MASRLTLASIGLAAVVACAGEADRPATPTSAPAATPTIARVATPTTAMPVTSTSVTAASPTTAGASPTTAGASASPEAIAYEIVNEYPHDPEAFTQGLAFGNGALFEGTGLLGESSLREVDLETGAVRREVRLPDDMFGEGIAVVDGRIYQLTWRSQTGFVYDARTFELLDQFSYTTDVWGLTYDGARLIVSDGTSGLSFRDPETFAETGRITVRDERGPVSGLNELEYMHGAVYANIWKTDIIARIDPATGWVSGRLDLSGLLAPDERPASVDDVLNGIAHDPATDRVFVTGKHWPSLFEIKLTTEP